MNFASVRIITEDVQRLSRFYEQLSGLTATSYTADFAEINFGAVKLAIGSTRTLQLFGGADLVSPGAKTPVIIEFRVEDVDQLYPTVSVLPGAIIVQPATTMPWGNRSLLLRDPDGNLVNLFTPLSGEAIRRQNSQ